MTTVQGGLRARLIRDSLYRMIQGYLDQLGWFDPDRDHLPINMIPSEPERSLEIPLNTLALSEDLFTSQAWEMGSLLAEERQLFYLDFYAEDNSIGIQMSRDIQAILEGRFGSLGRTGTTFKVYDWRMATPDELFYCDIDSVKIDKAHYPNRPYLEHWYSVSFYVIDYADSDLE